jgi:hypothetical protein|tara:strand:- start:412 stop:579 length:168 start_codon:yes stop_codon:yes gene_type:complete
MSQKADILEIVTLWSHDINDYLADDSIPADHHKNDIMEKLVSLKSELSEYLESDY